MSVARRQTLVQLSDELIAELDAVAARERRSRSDIIREAIVLHLGDARTSQIDRQIVDGYARMPETDDERRWADAGGRSMVAEEPW